MKFVPWGFSQGAAKIKIEQVEFEQKEITEIGSVSFRPETDDEVREKKFSGELGVSPLHLLLHGQAG